MLFKNNTTQHNTSTSRLYNLQITVYQLVFLIFTANNEFLNRTIHLPHLSTDFTTLAKQNPIFTKISYLQTLTFRQYLQSDYEKCRRRPKQLKRATIAAGRQYDMPQLHQCYSH
jgi:hypothetical protein